MYLTIRKYAGKGVLSDRLAAEMGKTLVPMLKQHLGYRGYCACASEDGHFVSVSFFEGREQAMAADERVGIWAAASLGDLLPQPPEVTVGEVLVSEEVR